MYDWEEVTENTSREKQNLLICLEMKQSHLPVTQF
jgi:hypothetical protein